MNYVSFIDSKSNNANNLFCELVDNLKILNSEFLNINP